MVRLNVVKYTFKIKIELHVWVFFVITAKPNPMRHGMSFSTNQGGQSTPFNALVLPTSEYIYNRHLILLFTLLKQTIYLNVKVCIGTNPSLIKFETLFKYYS